MSHIQNSYLARGCNGSQYPATATMIVIYSKHKCLSFTGATSAMSNEVGLSMTEGSMNRLVLHKEGLFAAGEDGVLRQLEVNHSGNMRVMTSYQIGSPVSTMSFNSSFNKLALGSSKVYIYYHSSSFETTA